jgi:hypothetical protein
VLRRRWRLTLALALVVRLHSAEDGKARVSRLLFIVSRSERQRYERFQAAFADDPDVRVILDRRYGERRQRNAPPGVDRRLKDRRSLDIEKHILQIGWTVANEKSHVEGEA